jgi:hypothetical protein
MKTFLKFFAIVVLFQSFGCQDDSETKNQAAQLESLQLKEQSIKDYIASFTCTENSSCAIIAFGSKACGGPKEFLVYSTSLNVNYLEQQVAAYNEQEANYNMQFNIVSDCLAVQPPENIGCVNGVCKALP